MDKIQKKKKSLLERRLPLDLVCHVHYGLGSPIDMVHEGAALADLTHEFLDLRFVFLAGFF